MKKIIISLLIISLVILIGCIARPPQDSKMDSKTFNVYEGQLSIYTKCVDKVVCYYYMGYKQGGMDCFREEDLVLKYCS